MGLAYVVALLRRLGGTVEVNSKPGEGSTFIVSMPRTLAQRERKAA
jgi:signal transduction histidine kinase